MSDQIKAYLAIFVIITMPVWVMVLIIIACFAAGNNPFRERTCSEFARTDTVPARCIKEFVNE